MWKIIQALPKWMHYNNEKCMPFKVGIAPLKHLLKQA